MITAGHQAMLTKSGIKIPEGTTFLLKTNTNTRVFDINSLVKAQGSDSITVDWGDGSPVEVYTANVSGVSHTYPSNDFYMFNVSDDVSSIGFKASTSRQLIACFLSFGQKVATFQNQCFQNETVDTNSNNASWCGLTDEQLFELIVKWTTDIEVVINATSLGSYSCFPWARNVRFANLTSVSGTPFYAGGLGKTQNLTFDSPNVTIPGNYLKDWSTFMDGWRTRYGSKNLTFTNKTVSQIKSMSNYPWQANTVSVPVYIHGSDGTIEFNT